MAKKKGNAGSKKKQRAAEAEAEADEPAPKKRKPSRQKGDASPQAEVERQEHIKGAMEYRLMGLPANCRALSGSRPGQLRRRPSSSCAG